MKTLVVTTFVAGFVGGFLSAGYCLAQGLKDGSLDDVIDRARAKYPRPHRDPFVVFDFNSLLDR